VNSPHDRLTGEPGSQSPGWTGRWAQGGRHLIDRDLGSASRDAAESDDLDALKSLKDSLGAAVQSGSWHELLEAPLLAGHDSDALELEKRERVLAENFPSIARICERFVTRLGERSELLPVSRVRRPARRALERMASHTEDWAGRTLSGPVPRRALAVMREENADLYENRMVNELIHPILSSALSDRIRRIRRLTADLADLERAKDEGTHYRRHRLYFFWGADAARAAESSGRAQGTLGRLEALAASVQALRGSTLAAALRGRRTGQRSLRNTNVIANDRHYRAAGIVWGAFEREAEAEESAKERAERLLARHRSFDNYAFGLIARALFDLGYEAAEDRMPASGAPFILLGPWGKAELVRSPDGTMVLSARNTSTRFVPLADVVGPNDDHPEILTRWQSMDDAVKTPTVVLYLAPSQAIRSLPQDAARPMMSAGRDAPSQGLLLTGVPISPLETTSLERVARAVAVAVRSPALLDYPAQVRIDGERVPRRLIDHLLSSGLSRGEPSPLFNRAGVDAITVRRPLTPRELSELDNLVRQLKDRTKSPGWERDFVREIDGLSAAIQEAAESVAPLLTCPLCQTASHPSEVARDGDVFSVACRSCRARWGHERCGSCGERVPVIEPESQIRNPDVVGPGWVERIYGQDALASPCWARTVPGRYVCTECGSCPVAANEAAHCTRCKGGTD